MELVIKNPYVGHSSAELEPRAALDLVFIAFLSLLAATPKDHTTLADAQRHKVQESAPVDQRSVGTSGIREVHLAVFDVDLCMCSRDLTVIWQADSVFPKLLARRPPDE